MTAPGTGTRLVLSRHGQSVWHRENRYAGVSDIDLTELGYRQARALASWCVLHPPAAVYSSPVRRARLTAGPVGEALGVPVRVVDDLREIDFGVAEGRTLSELAGEMPEAVDGFRRDPARNPFPGGESPAVAAKRGAAALRDIAAASPGGTVLVVAHNTLLRLALCELLAIEIGRYREVFPRLDNGAVTEIHVTVPASPASAGGIASAEPAAASAGGIASAGSTALCRLNVPLPPAPADRPGGPHGA